MKRLFIGLFILAGAVALIGCKKDNVDKRLEELEKEENVYAISLVSGIDQVISNSSVNLIDSNAETDADQIDNLDLLLGLLNEEVFDVDAKESDNDNFDNLLEITINQEKYMFYYNEVLIEREEDEDEIEEEFKIDGLILFGDLEFNVIGKKDVEIEEDEEEFELELKVSLDSDNYTIIKYEIETESDELERNYKLETYVDGNLVRKVKIDFEVEDDELELEVEIEEDNKESKYELKHFEGKDKAVIKYEIKENGQTFKGIINVSVIIEDDTVRYIYE